MSTIGKIGTVIASLLLAANLRGDGAAPTAAEKAAMRERLLANTGGFVIKPGSGPAIVALDLREAPDSAPAKVKAVLTTSTASRSKSSPPDQRTPRRSKSRRGRWSRLRRCWWWRLPTASTVSRRHF